MPDIPYLKPALALIAFALFLILPIRVRLDLKQHGLCVRLFISASFLFGLIRIPVGRLIEFEPGALIKKDAKNAVRVFKITKNGEKKPMKRKKPKRGGKLRVLPLIRKLAFERLILSGELALEDAALAVELCGIVNAALAPAFELILRAAKLAASRARTGVFLRPAFNKNALRLDFEGIAKTNAVKLISGFISAKAQKRSKRKEPKALSCKQSGKRKGEKPCTLLKT